MVNIFLIIPLALQNSYSSVFLCTGNLSKNDMHYTSRCYLRYNGQNKILPTKWQPLLTCSRPRFLLLSHSLVRSKTNSQFVGIKPQLKKDLFKVCGVCKKINYLGSDGGQILLDKIIIYIKNNLWFYF